MSNLSQALSYFQILTEIVLQTSWKHINLKKNLPNSYVF